MKLLRACAGCREPAVNAQGFRLYCERCDTIVLAIRAAVKDAMGGLPNHDGQRCEDCGLPAHARDHRNYSSPRVVAYVCRRCNQARGPAEDIAYMVAKYKCLASGTMIGSLFD